MESSIGRSQEARQRYEDEISSSSECLHLFTTMWDLSICDACQQRVSDDRLRCEETSAEEVRIEDLAVVDQLHQRAVRVDWLVAFTRAHDCWDWPTWRVNRDIIKPTTREDRCRQQQKLISCMPVCKSFVVCYSV